MEDAGKRPNGRAKAGKSSLLATMCMKRKRFDKIREIVSKSYLVAFKALTRRGGFWRAKKGN
ncbi:MAG: hypothetical protein ABSF71_16195 [Terriglobia bacterium]|jgi:uncharacterized protein YebE (UPF0316 family)